MSAPTQPPLEAAKNSTEDYKFWKTQPVRRLEDTTEETVGPIEADKPVSEVQQTPYTLPNGFEWSVIDISTDEQASNYRYKLILV